MNDDGYEPPLNGGYLPSLDPYYSLPTQLLFAKLIPTRKVRRDDAEIDDGASFNSMYDDEYLKAVFSQDAGIPTIPIFCFFDNYQSKGSYTVSGCNTMWFAIENATYTFNWTGYNITMDAIERKYFLQERK